jgi:peptidoglycan/xylan/chitin deacetylase (PgdA/CDA1 family)
MKRALIQLYKSTLGHTERLFGRLPSENELLVACMHSTPKDRLADFEKLVETLRKRFTFLDPSDLPLYLENPNNFTNGPYFLFTFDDGLANNLESAKVLAAHKIKAIYFVVPDFIDSTDQNAYYRANIRPIVDEKIDHETSDTTAMSWSDLAALAKMGHCIGNHTKTHCLHQGMSIQEIEAELSYTDIKIQEKIGAQPLFFASPNNTLESVGNAAAQVILRNKYFHFTTIPGLHARGENPKNWIYRRNIEVHWGQGAIEFALGSFDLSRWQKQRDALSLLVRASHLDTSSSL